MIISFFTLGCRLNQAEEEALRRQFLLGGYLISDPKEADVCIVNSCSVTGTADRKTRQAVKRLKRENPKLAIVVIGCGAEATKSWPEVVLWIPNSRKSETYNLVLATLDNGPVRKIKNKNSHRTRALLKIQDGCNNFCAYCIVPVLRGRETSISPAEIIKEAKILQKMGYQELVLTGVNVGKYRDGNLDLTGLIKQILAKTDFPRIRLSSVNPQDITGELIELWAKNPRLCHHWHLSLQSGTTNILKKMGRPYTAKEYYLLCKKVVQKIPEMAITTDLIVGFPGETEKDFRETCDFVTKVGLARLHVFRYSKRNGTRAEMMTGQVPDSTKKDRSRELILIGKKLEDNFRQKFIGQEVEVLFEEKKPDPKKGENGFWYGLTSNYIKVKYPPKEDLKNKIIKVKLTKDNLA